MRYIRGWNAVLHETTRPQIVHTIRTRSEQGTALTSLPRSRCMTSYLRPYILLGRYSNSQIHRQLVSLPPRHIEATYRTWRGIKHIAQLVTCISVRFTVHSWFAHVVSA